MSLAASCFSMWVWLELLKCFEALWSSAPRRPCSKTLGWRHAGHLCIPSGNQTWQWKIRYKWRISRKITELNRVFSNIFHCHVWLRKANPARLARRLWSPCCDGVTVEGGTPWNPSMSREGDAETRIDSAWYTTQIAACSSCRIFQRYGQMHQGIVYWYYQILLWPGLIFWLVVWNICYFPRDNWDHFIIPIDELIFFRGVGILNWLV